MKLTNREKLVTVAIFLLPGGLLLAGAYLLYKKSQSKKDDSIIDGGKNET